MNFLFLKIYKKLMPIRNKIASSKNLIKLIFQLKIPQNIDVNFDMTTLLLRYSVTKEIKKEQKILEIGIGTGALISNFIAKKFNCVTSGVDISERRVKQSQIISEYNDIETSFIQSNLFDKISDKYDFIIFNPPYVPTKIGEKLDIDKYHKNDEDRLAWDGGENGMNIIDRFLDQGINYLRKNGKIILGVQGLYINRAKIEKCISNKSLYICNIYKLPLLTSVVYVFS